MAAAPSARGREYLVLNRSWADLYDGVAEAFADRPDIRVVVDRRKGGRDRRRLLMGSGRALGASVAPLRREEGAS